MGVGWVIVWHMCWAPVCWIDDGCLACGKEVGEAGWLIGVWGVVVVWILDHSLVGWLVIGLSLGQQYVGLPMVAWLVRRRLGREGD